MQRIPLALALVVALASTAVLAGCIQSDPAATNDLATEDAPTANLTAVKPTEINVLDGTVTLGVGGAVSYFVPTTLVDSRFLEVDVGKNATAMVVELTWGNKMNDLDITVWDSEGARAASFTGGSHGAGDSPLRVVLTGDDLLAAGSYTFGVWAKNSVNEKFKLAVSVFYGEPVADDFTGLQ